MFFSLLFGSDLLPLKRKSGARWIIMLTALFAIAETCCSKEQKNLGSYRREEGR